QELGAGRGQDQPARPRPAVRHRRHRRRRPRGPGVLPGVGGHPLMSRICVFCGSSMGFSPRYAEQAAALGKLLAQRGIGLVYGGAYYGPLMSFADHMVTEGFLKADYRGLLLTDADPAALLDAFETYEPPAPPKWAAGPPGT